VATYETYTNSVLVTTGSDREMVEKIGMEDAVQQASERRWTVNIRVFEALPNGDRRMLWRGVVSPDGSLRLPRRGRLVAAGTTAGG
jgi:hypothetical protein